MKVNTAVLALRPLAPTLRPLPGSSSRFYATQNSLGAAPSPAPRRRTVTAFNDDGFVPWNELSAGEKASRATQQSFNFGIIVAGMIATGAVGYFLWTDVFSPDSRTAQFNRAVDRIKQDERCIEILGDSKKITAHGEETMNKWRRARPISTLEKSDAQGDHLMMHFHVDGPRQNGTAHVHLIKRRGQSDYEYKHLFLDAKGHERIYLERSDAGSSVGKKALSMFGVKWS
ncbi:TIM21 domain-containing protein [Sarocladium implicatum]|nr:TIM21 domain-containing protein [Sarocladium implicatum]